MLQFAVLFSALAVDLFLEGKPPSKLAGPATLIVLAGVFLVGSSGKPASSSANLGTATLGAIAAMASGMGFVLSARFCMPRDGDDANSIVFVSFVASGILVFPAVVASWYYATGFHVRFEDLHLWIFAGCQGLFYTRSFQILPNEISYAATFTLSLAAQLVAAALVDVSTGPFSNFKGTVGLSCVFLGVVLREMSPKLFPDGRAKQLPLHD
jgi:drug/metabolite transporter (DMT)-like permease